VYKQQWYNDKNSTGLFPISQAIAVALPGALVLLMTVWIAFQPELKVFSARLTSAEAEG
jgi:hypothetical protein